MGRKDDFGTKCSGDVEVESVRSLNVFRDKDFSPLLEMTVSGILIFFVALRTPRIENIRAE
jgi:hypothetical protein